MKTTKIIHATFASALLAFAGCATSPHNTAAWEYRLVGGLDNEQALQERLNQAGSEGYVIVSSTAIPGDAAHSPRLVVILKRPKQ